jgi:alpha-tubulin suppressor-like RCC1 family protein
MGFLADGWMAGSWRRHAASTILVAIVGLLWLVMASPAHAANIGWAWGLNQSGQLGIGTAGPEECGSERKQCSTTPLEVSGLTGIKAMAGGADHSLALLESGGVMAWGADASGQLGNGQTEERSRVPVAVCAAGEISPCVKALSAVTAVAAGESHSLALLSNGTVQAWGANGAGELGDGTTSSSDVPVAVCAVGETAPCASDLSGVTAIAAGQNHSLALLSNGTVMAWGFNGQGQLGDGSTTGSAVPVEVKGLSGVVAIYAGYSSSLALLSNGTVMAWGVNNFGQLGDGGEAKSALPVRVCAVGEKAPCAKNLEGVKAISAGHQHALALLTNGTVVAWGRNLEGQLGDGSPTGPESCGVPPVQPCSKTPVAVSNLAGVGAIAAGGNHSMALLSSGSVEAWGDNEQGQLGVGTSTGPEPCGPFATPCSTTPVAVLTHGVASGIAAGGEHSLAFGPPPPAPTSLPEWGRCVKAATPHTGGYKYANCIIHSATHTGEYEWHPGPGTVNPTYEIVFNTVRLETASKKAIQCGGFMSGEYTDSKHATVLLDLIGCGLVGSKPQERCQSGPEEGTIEAPRGGLEAEIGFIKGGKKAVVGWDIKPKEGSTEVISVDCGPVAPENQRTPSLAWVVEGSVIGKMKKINKMYPTFLLAFASSEGNQLPERFEGGLKDTLLSTIVGLNPPSPPVRFIPTVLKTHGEKLYAEVENGEPFEIKAN